MLLQMSVQSLVNAIVEQELVGKGRPDQGLYFAFDVGLTLYRGDDGECIDAKRRSLHLLYQANPEQTYIHVFSSTTDSPFSKPTDSDVIWQHEGSHDSCWRTCNAIDSLYFEMAEEINATLPAKQRRSPADMTQFVNPQLFRGLFRWLPCKVERDNTDTRGYRRTLTLL
jgi:hypothetical protein